MKKLICLAAVLCLLSLPRMAAASEYEGINEYAGVHPRLLLSEDEFENIRRRAEGPLNDIWTAFAAECDKIVSNGPVLYYVDSNTEDLWMRSVGDNIMKLSFAYKISGDEKYKTAATENAETAGKYPTWGRGSAFENKDLAAAHLLRGISCYYDWLYHDLSASEKASALETLYVHGDIMKNCSAWWNRSFLQNHMWICLTSIVMTSAAIYDEYPAAADWMTEANRLYATVFEYLSGDGSLHEGHMYWEYGMEFLLNYADTAKKFCGIDYSNTDYMKNNEYYGVYMLTPRNKTNGKVTDCFDFADASANNGAGFVSVLAYLARLNQNKQTQWFVDYIYKTNKASSDMWTMLMYYDTELESQPPSDKYPYDKHFENLGYVFMRSGWGDNESAVAMKCGSCLGKQMIKNYSHSDFGTGHVHPDVNHFVIFANGQRLLTDDGYAAAYCRNHNTLNINGTGQYGEGGSWPRPEAIDAEPEIERFVSSENYAYIAANAVNSYTPETGLEKFKRHLLYLRGGAVIVIDDAEMNNKNAGDKMELRFFSGINFEKTLDKGSFLFNNNIVEFKIQPFENGNISEYKKIERTYNKAGNTRAADAVCISSNTGTLLQATAFSWCEKDGNMPEIEMIQNGSGTMQFKVTYKNRPLYPVKYTVDYEKNSVTEQQMYPFGAEIKNNTVTLNGALPYGINKKCAVKITGPGGDTEYIGQFETDVEGEYAVEAGIKQLKEGTYTVSIMNGEYIQPVTRSFSVGRADIDVVVTGCAVSGGENASAQVVLSNRSGAAREVRLILASYGEDGTLCGIAVKYINIENETEDVYNISLSGRGEYSDVRLMVWNNSMQPLMTIN